MKKIIEKIIKPEGQGDHVDPVTNQNELFMEAIVWVALLSLCLFV